MSFLIVTPLSCLEKTAEKYRPRDMVTLINAGTHVIRPPMVPEYRHLGLYFNDINEDRRGFVAPARKHVTALLQFVSSWNQKTPLLIHCYMGISRSTAAAFITACALNPDMDEKLLAARLRDSSPSATPNPRLVSIADQLLERAGKMNKAVEQIGRGCDSFEGSPFIFDFSSDPDHVKIKN